MSDYKLPGMQTRNIVMIVFCAIGFAAPTILSSDATVWNCLGWFTAAGQVWFKDRFYTLAEELIDERREVTP